VPHGFTGFEPVKGFERLPLHVLHVLPGTLAVNQLVLVDTAKRIGQSMLVAGSLGSNRDHEVRAAESLAVPKGEVLNAAIAVMNKMRGDPPHTTPAYAPGGRPQPGTAQ